MILTAFTGIALAVAVGLWSGQRTVVGANRCAKNLDEAAVRVAGGDSYVGMCPVTQLAYVKGDDAGEVCCPGVDRHGGEERSFCASPDKPLAPLHPPPGRSKRLYTLAAEVVAGVLLTITIGAHVALSIAMRRS